MDIETHVECSMAFHCSYGSADSMSEAIDSVAGFWKYVRALVFMVGKAKIW